jgi:protein-tyrosine phosphatase
MTEVLQVSDNSTLHEVVARAVSVLSQGELVAFPTETVYGIAARALDAAAVQRLRQGKGRPADKPLTLAIASPAEALDWVPGMTDLGRRLANRCWPGPLTLVFSAGVETGLLTRLPEEVRSLVAPAGNLGLRVPAHEVILQTLRQLSGPLVLTSANRSGHPAATTAAEVLEALQDEVPLVIDGGPSRFGQSSTVVQVNANGWHILREGVLSTADVTAQAAKLILFVCTGNTCRSPLAEGLCKKLLAEHLGCNPSELPQRGFLVQSAGLAAIMGSGAAEDAIATARELGVDLGEHRSRPLTAQMATRADLVFAMTRSHVLALAAHSPNLAPRLRLLSPEGEDLADPVGCEREVYQECAQQILQYLQKQLPELTK